MTIETGSHYPMQLSTLPERWRAGFVGDFAKTIEPGFASGEYNKFGDGIPHLRPMNIDREGKLDLTVVKSVAESKDSRRLAKGDVLFNNTNSPELVGKTTVIARDGKFAFSNHMTRIRFGVDVSPAFAALQLHYLWMCGYFKYNCVKHVNQASISSGTLARMVPFVWAPPDEQEAIVAEIEKQFSRLDEAVASLERVKANLKRYTATVLHAAAAGRLQSSDGSRTESCEPSSSDLPSGWQLVTVDQAGDVLLGRQRAPRYLTGIHPKKYLRVANIKDDAIAFGDIESMDFDEKHFEKYRLVDGDILVSEGQSPELLGQSAIFRGHYEPLCFQKTLHRFRARPGITTPEFAQIVFRAHVKSGLFRRIGSITINIGHLTLEKFKAAPFPLPPLAEQRRIVAEVDRRLSIVREVEAEVETNLKRSQALRQTVLQSKFGIVEQGGL